MDKRIVMAFGRFNPPTKGHAQLIDLVKQVGAAAPADAVVFVSPAMDAVRNPIPLRTKVAWLCQLFPGITFMAMKTPFDALHALVQLGYNDIIAVVGNDRVDEFRRIGDNYQRWAKKQIGVKLLDRYEVASLSMDQGPSSAKLRQYAVEGDFDKFWAGTPTKNETLARLIYNTARKNLHEAKRSVRKAAPKSTAQSASVHSIRHDPAPVLLNERSGALTDSALYRECVRRVEAYTKRAQSLGNARRVRGGRQQRQPE